MIKQRLTLSALSAMLMCNMAYAQIYEHQILIDTTMAVKKPITRKINNIDYGTRTQRHTPVIALGDVNEDGNVSDGLNMINYVLGSAPSPFNTEAADMNGDNDVTILDVTMLINLILSQPAE